MALHALVITLVDRVRIPNIVRDSSFDMAASPCAWDTMIYIDCSKVSATLDARLLSYDFQKGVVSPFLEAGTARSSRQGQESQLPQPFQTAVPFLRTPVSWDDLHARVTAFFESTRHGPSSTPLPNAAPRSIPARAPNTSSFSVTIGEPSSPPPAAVGPPVPDTSVAASPQEWGSMMRPQGSSERSSSLAGVRTLELPAPPAIQRKMASRL